MTQNLNLTLSQYAIVDMSIAKLALSQYVIVDVSIAKLLFI